MNNKLLIICGPTAAGKTKLAAKLARKFHGELVSADSRQVYRGNDLETNKERPDVPIWLYDVADHGSEFSVSHWVKLARQAIADIQIRNKLPIIVGGTGLYINAFIHPFESIDIPPDKTLREKNLSVKELQKMVPRGDMNDSDWNNPRRLIRKIEIANFKRSHLARQSETLKKKETLVIGLTAPLPALYKRIDEHLRERRSLGMKGTVGNEHAIARRQMTWFNKQPDIVWFDIRDPDVVGQVTRKVFSWYTKREAHED